MPEPKLAELCSSLEKLSHDDEALRVVQEFSARFPNSKARIDSFNVIGALLRSPITTDQTAALGFNEEEDVFSVLQGDIITSESAYFMGERVCSRPNYVVLNSSCDLVPKRRRYASLLRITPIRDFHERSREHLNVLLKFKKADAMYLPALPEDDPDVLCNAVQFDGLCQILSEDLELAGRTASLSVVGWRIFASFSRVVIARANPREMEMRTAVENAQGDVMDPVNLNVAT